LHDGSCNLASFIPKEYGLMTKHVDTSYTP
jgi:hypothetical protein